MSNLSQTENRALMQQARETLQGVWGLAIGTFFVYALILVVSQQIPKVGMLVYLVIAGPMILGATIFSLAFSRKNNPKFEQLFDGFKNFGVSLAAFLLQSLFIILWSLLLIVPGIVAAISYSLTFYIIAEDKSISPLDAITKSKELMDGNKWKFFCLSWRFFGWIILSILTVGIGFLWLMPYMMISFAKFYDDIPKTAAETNLEPGAESLEAGNE